MSILGRLEIVSDFSDYYDYLSDESAVIRYTRVRELNRQQGMCMVHRAGLPMAEVKKVREFTCFDTDLVVYLDDYKHGVDTKIRTNYLYAVARYPDKFAARFYRSIDGFTYKLLGIGKTRLLIVIRNISELTTGDVVDVKALENKYEESIRIPMYSIDYVNTSSGMVAVDFNEVENLKNLGIDRFLKPGIVYSELYKASAKFVGI